MRVSIGPMEPTGARAWIGWAREVVADLRRDPAKTVTLPEHVLDDVDGYLESWADAAHGNGDGFRWEADVHPDEVVYLTNSLFNLDALLAEQGRRCPRRPEPTEGRVFHAVLVDVLLFSLAQAGPSQAAFAEQLRPQWSVVVWTDRRRLVDETT